MSFWVVPCDYDADNMIKLTDAEKEHPGYISPGSPSDLRLCRLENRLNRNRDGSIKQSNNHQHTWSTWDFNRLQFTCKTCNTIVTREMIDNYGFDGSHRLIPECDITTVWDYYHYKQEKLNGQRTQIPSRDSRVRSNELSASETKSENTRNHISQQSEEREVIIHHNWHHDRFNRWYVCVARGNATSGAPDECNGCGVKVTFDLVNQIDKTSQSASERHKLVDKFAQQMIEFREVI